MTTDERDAWFDTTFPDSGISVEKATARMCAEIRRLDAEVERLRAGLREIAEMHDWCVRQCPIVARRVLGEPEAS